MLDDLRENAMQTNVADVSASAGRRKLLTRKEAAKYLTEHYGPTSEPALAKAAVTGGGPPYRKYGRWPLYAEADLDTYGESRLGPLVTSTAQMSGAAKGKGGRRPTEKEAA